MMNKCNLLSPIPMSNNSPTTSKMKHKYTKKYVNLLTKMKFIKYKENREIL